MLVFSKIGTVNLCFETEVSWVQRKSTVIRNVS